MKHSVALLIAVVTMVAGVGGYFIGSGGAPSDTEAKLAEQLSFHRTAPIAESRAKSAAQRAAFPIGRKLGERRARRLGYKDGLKAGSNAAEAEVEQLAAEQEVAELAEQEAAEERHCNVPLFVPGTCPTQAEIEQENQAESEGGIGD